MTNPRHATRVACAVATLPILLQAVPMTARAADCSEHFTPISAIQGEGATAAITGTVTTQGVVVGDFEFLLRAERGGSGAGRIYTITYRASDSAGNAVEQAVTVTVPANRR